jgi:glutathione S-transferase
MFDERAVHAPREFRVDRPSTDYLHFGHGLHTCFGLEINRVHLAALATALLEGPPVTRAPERAGRLRWGGPYPVGLVVSLSQQESDLALITFPPSLDSEFSRFLLTHYGVAHREERHVMPFHLFFTLLRGRTVRFPLLYGDGRRLNTVKKIIDHYEPLASADRRLVPPGTAATAKADWATFHTELNTATTIFAYHHLLPHREIMVRPLSEGTPKWEAAAVERGYPLFEGLLRLLLRPTDQRAAKSLETIRTVLARVDERLADGRRYLNGDRFTLSDMAFANAASPVVWPEAYGGAVPGLSETPPGLRSVVDECRSRPSGELALRIYRDHRAGPA